MAAVAVVVVLAAVVAVEAVGSSRNGSDRPAGSAGSVDRTASAGARPAGSATDAGRGRGASTGASFAVGTTELNLVDSSRVAVVDGRAGPRQLPTEVWYPVGGARQPRPLVVFAAGFLQCPDQYGPLLASWAAAGFVVAAPTFPLTNCDVPGGADEADILNQPADVVFVARQLVAAGAGDLPLAGAGVLRGRIDSDEIAVAGQSDGGDTVAALAANTCCRTLAVQALVVLSGAELASYGGSYFPPGSPPMLVVQGTADTVNVPADSLALYQADQAGPKALVLLDGADHLGPYEGTNPTEHLVSELTVAFLREWLDHATTAGAALARLGNLPGVDSIELSGGPAAGSS